ncbi:unnamed protein product [Heterobilharzia americana]|nr:unnamed protein product [Heterobilharzia americana]
MIPTQFYSLFCLYHFLCSYSHGCLCFVADKINTILKAANVKFVEPYLPNLFASCLNGRSVKDMLMSMGSAAAAAPSAAPAVASGGADKAQEPAKAEEKKPVSEDESDESMGFDLFG